MAKLEDYSISKSTSDKVDHAEVQQQQDEGTADSSQASKPPTGSQQWKNFYAQVAQTATKRKHGNV